MGLFGDSGSSIDVVTSAHAHIDACFVAGIDGFSYARAQRIHQRKYSDHGEARLHSLFVGHLLKIVVVALLGLPCRSVNVKVSHKQGSVTFSCEILDGFLDDLLFL